MWQVYREKNNFFLKCCRSSKLIERRAILITRNFEINKMPNKDRTRKLKGNTQFVQKVTFET